ncbi:MAG: hypothetical protein M4D80_37695 [Myxococcota bacterium]|nr:hypothetical protein [Myxococcota bacterium]
MLVGFLKGALITAAIFLCAVIIVAECTRYNPHSGPAYARHREKVNRQQHLRGPIVDAMRLSEAAQYEPLRQFHRSIGEAFYAFACHDVDLTA